jgi:PAS domain S-box-containing protein
MLAIFMKKLFLLPDKETNYSGYNLYMLTMIWLVISGVIVSIEFYVFPDMWLRWSILLGALFFLTVTSLILNAFDYTRLGSWFFSIMLWMYVTIPCYSEGGIIAPGIVSQMTVIFTAVFLIGWRGCFVIGLLTIAADLGLAYVEMIGQLPDSIVLYNPVMRWVATVAPLGTLLTIQYFFTNQLHAGIIEIQSEEITKDGVGKIKDKTVHALAERIKELTTLYTISQHLKNEGTPFSEIFKEIAELLPTGWQYPECTAACISIDEIEYASSNYRPSEYFMFAELKTSIGTKVRIEIVYLQNMPRLDEGPFLKEERSLINMLAEMLKIYVEDRERTIELKDYKYVLDNASIVSITDAYGIFNFVNENFCAISKYTKEELIGKPSSMIWSGYHAPDYFEQLKSAMQDGKIFRGEVCHKAKDGSLYWIDVTVVPFLDAHGRVYKYLAMNQDITERKKVADLYNYQYYNSPDTILIVNKNFIIETINRVYSDKDHVNDIIGRDAIEVLPIESREISRAALSKCFETGENQDFENALTYDRWVSSRMVPIISDGEVNHVMIFVSDITKRKQIQLELQQSEIRNRALIENISEAIVLIDASESILYQSPAVAKITGYLPEDRTSKNLFSFIHPEEIESFKMLLQHVQNSPNEPIQALYRFIHKKGNIIWLEGTFVNLIHNESIKGIVLNYRDVTERKDAEEKSKQSEALINKITSRVPGNTYLFEIEESGDCTIIFTNRGTDMFNHTFDEVEVLAHPEILREILHEEDKVKFNNAMKEAYQTEAMISFQYRIMVGEHIRWRWIQAFPEKERNGQTKWYGATRDITPLVDYVISIEQILFDIGHVIRRPISTMKGMTNMITGEDLNLEDIKNVASRLYMISDEMDTFINELNLAYQEKKQHTKYFNIDLSSSIDKRSSLFD